MKRLLLVFLLVAICLGVMAAPAAAHVKKPLVCRVDMAVGSDAYPDYWGGTVRGDIRGAMEVHELPWSDQGPVLYTFAESFLITTRCGTIKGFDMGIWYPDFSFNASGWVTEATGKWSYLVGWMFYQAGATSDANVLPVTISDGLLVFMPPLENRWGWMRH
jgi:hypothetical protein